MNTVHIFPGHYKAPFGRRRDWYVRLVASNGQTLSISEGYWSKGNAKRAARRMYPGLTVREVEA